MTMNRQLGARVLTLATCATLSLVLGACGKNQARPGVRPALVQTVNNDRQLDDVVSALKLGDVKRARKMLKAMAKRDPADQRIAVLREGIEADPVEKLGGLWFNHRVESGDQLTTLAQRHLGNRLKFYLLARYNGLKTDELRPGQLLRIPGFAPAPKPRVEARPQPRVEPRQEPRATAAPALPRPQTAPPAATPTDPAAAGRLRAQALAALNRGAVANGVTMLRRARALDPANVAIRNDLARAERLFTAVKARR